ncbi:hypothetical protein [Nonomuraea angiospora]|uniref:hypothetical protein n=1 Tax=Nonomuraea angiospora TaxID=46172 RepID=UPI003F541C87
MTCGSRTDSDGRTHAFTVRQLRDALDRRTGLGWADGYVGHGVATTNLAGRTLRDLVLGRETELTGLPWVGRRVRRWEPAPLRWLGVRGMYAAYREADRHRGLQARLATRPSPMVISGQNSR